MKAKWFIGLFLFSTLTAQGTTFTVSDALLSDELPRTNFTLGTFTRQYLRKSPKVAAQKNTLLNARATYQNAFAEAFLPSFSVSATADKTYFNITLNQPAETKITLDETLDKTVSR